MKNILRRIERKLIKLNTLLIRAGQPRIPKKNKEIDITFKGKNVLDDLLEQNDKIFSGFRTDDKVLIKININSSNPYPASTSSTMLETLIIALNKKGIKKITVADSSGVSHLPTRFVFKEKKFGFLKKYGIRFKSLDYGPWARIPIDGKYFKEFILSRYIYNFDRIINLSNIKSHSRSGFTFSTKLLVGLMHPAQRVSLHKDHLVQRIAELSLAIRPDISIIDGRKIFYSGGPDCGEVDEPGVIIVSNDLFKSDLAAYKLLVEYKSKHGLDDLEKDPYKNKFFKHFLEIYDDAK